MYEHLSLFRRYLSSSQPMDKKLKFLFWGLIQWQWLGRMERHFQKIGLAYLLDSQAYLLYMFRMHAFMSRTYDRSDTILSLALNHFEVVAKQLTTQQIDRLYSQEGLVIYASTLEGYNITLKVEYDERMRFEGLMTLKVLVNDEELYFLHFILSDKGAYVGGVQGAKGQLELNRILTKITHGLRPQNLVYFAFTVLCQAWQQPQIWGIKNTYHVYQNESKSKEKVLFDFELFWEELGGLTDSEEWMRLPIPYVTKPLEEIPTKKRSTYRKRYELMTEIAQAIRQRLSHDAE